MCSGKGSIIGSDDREHSGSGLHTVGIRVRLGICNEKGNGKGNEGFSIERMFAHFSVSCFFFEVRCYHLFLIFI